MTQTIALVDDDKHFNKYKYGVRREGYKVQTYIDGESALIGLTKIHPIWQF